MKSKIFSLLGLSFIAFLVFFSPFESESSGVTDMLRGWGAEQKETSEQITSDLVSDLEGPLVGEHKDDGSNWSIPNLLRQLFGGIGND